jgi:pSer/pThr/pTyr-binding forkhead associated (FHA) protein
VTEVFLNAGMHGGGGGIYNAGTQVAYGRWFARMFAASGDVGDRANDGCQGMRGDMAEETLGRLDVPEVLVQLLDHGAGRPVKTWKFPPQPRISIGRDPGQDIELSDPFVSRAHAELKWEDGEWTLFSRGRHGVLVENQLITEYPIHSEVTFRLGLGGPTLRFIPATPADPGTQTLSYDKMPVELLELDKSKLERDIQEITEGDYFQQLKEKTQRLRGRRDNT